MNKRKGSKNDSALQLQTVIESAIDGIITIDEQGIIESINPAALKLFGYEASELIGEKVNLLMPSPHREEHDTYMDNYHRTGRAKIIGIDREVSGVKKDGTIFPLRLAVGESWLNEKRIYTGIIHDLTEVKEAEDEIRRLNTELEQKVTERTEKLADVVNRLLKTNQQLETEIYERKAVENALIKSQKDLQVSLEKERELNELKSRFVSMASHEFRTPLSTILSSVTLIGRYVKGDQQAQRQKHIHRIKSAVQNMTGILNDFLSLSKLEEGKVQSQPEAFNIHTFCDELLDEINSILKENQSLHIDKPDENLEVYMDKRNLKNIFFNLMSNAIKYSEDGTKISCKLYWNEQFLHISVQDEGIGIPEEDQQHLFSRFFRAENAMNIQGTGLGLNIIKKYIDMMGGKISFSSELGKGSTFSVVLPIRQ